MDPVAGKGEPEDARCTAGRSLLRLVGFVASALDVRFAFVVAFEPPGGPRSLAIWLARDFGLRSEYGRLELTPGEATAATRDFGQLLGRVWPHEPELAEIRPDRCVSLSLKSADGHAVGYLGILEAERNCRLGARERLAPLARRAGAEVEQWVGATT
jgi:hypothetical protein